MKSKSSIEPESEEKIAHDAYVKMMRIMLFDYTVDILHKGFTDKDTVKDILDYIDAWAKKHFKGDQADWDFETTKDFIGALSSRQETGLNVMRKSPDV